MQRPFCGCECKVEHCVPHNTTTGPPYVEEAFERDEGKNGQARIKVEEGFAVRLAERRVS